MREGGHMRRWSLLALTAVLMLVAAACAADDGDENGGGGGGGGGETNGGQAEDTGRVNVLNALSVDEGTALQAVVDETFTDVEYEVEIEASDQFEEQLQIRA